MCVYVIKAAHISEISGNRRSLRFTDAKACKNLIFSVVVEVPYSLFAGNIPAAYVAGTFGARDFVPRRIVAFRPKPFPIFIPLEYPDFITRIQLEQFFTGNVRRRADIHSVINNIMITVFVIIDDNIPLRVYAERTHNKQQTPYWFFRFQNTPPYMFALRKPKVHRVSTVPL